MIKEILTYNKIDYYFLFESGWWVESPVRDERHWWHVQSSHVVDAIKNTHRIPIESLPISLQHRMTKYAWMFNDPFSWEYHSVLDTKIVTLPK